MSTSETAAPTFRRTLQLLCASLMASLVVILMAVAAVLGSDGSGGGNTPVWAFAVVLAVAVLGVSLITTFGFRITPIAPGTPEPEARLASARALQTSTILRFVFAESIALVALLLAFVVDAGGLYLLVVGIAIAEVLMFFTVWPSERVIGRVQQALERDGARSYLREALDAPPPPRIA